VQKAIKAGMVIKFEEDGLPRIVETTPIPDEEWGFNASVIKRAAIEMEWPDKELIHFLEFGFHDYSENTPPVSSISPHQQKALDNLAEFKANIAKDITKGWICGRPTPWPGYIPFRVIPGSVEPKKQIGMVRIVWNASHPMPQGREGIVIDAKHGQIPINSNEATKLPRYLEFEWAAPEAIAMAISILRTLALKLKLPILGRTYDFSGWFRQLKMARPEAWKSNLLLDDGFHADLRMQMGRSASAHSGQRLSSLIAEKLARLAQEHEWGRECYTDRQLEIIQDWSESRIKIWKTPVQTRTTIFMAYQDDLTTICIGKESAPIIDAHIAATLQSWRIPRSARSQKLPDLSARYSTR